MNNEAQGQTQTFSSRWGMLLAVLGMALGTGNIWRFPRIVAANGGGSFLIAWVVFLLLWSVPLLILEFSMGKGTRVSTVGTFIKLMGRKFAWMGAWVAFVSIAIMFYYSVVTGWTIRFFWASAAGELQGEMPGALWASYAGSPTAVFTHFIAMGIGIWIVAKGVRGIERAASILIPVLTVLVLMLTIRAVTLPGAGQGFAFLFTPEWSDLADARIWLEALTQNAWDTGAGWGLALTYAIYMKRNEDTALNGFLTPFANNAMSLVAAIMVICTVFAVGPAMAGKIAQTPAGFEQAIAAYPGLEGELESALREQGLETVSAQSGVQITEETLPGFFANESIPVETRLAVARGSGALAAGPIADAVLASGNNGLTFIWVPQIFETLPFGRLLTSIFFLALAVAAVAALISMIELAVRVLQDGGMARGKALWLVAICGLAFGIPSALSMEFFENQDNVWGVGLTVSGLFLALAVARYGARRFRERYINHEGSDIYIGRWMDYAVWGAVVQAVVLMGWWIYQAIDFDDLAATFTPFSTFNVGTIAVQWAIALGVFIALNGWMARKTETSGGSVDAEEEVGVPVTP